MLGRLRSSERDKDSSLVQDHKKKQEKTREDRFSRSRRTQNVQGPDASRSRAQAPVCADKRQAVTSEEQSWLQTGEAAC